MNGPKKSYKETKMNISKNLIISALVFPVVALGIFTAFKKYKIEVGTKIVLPISGYDP